MRRMVVALAVVLAATGCTSGPHRLASPLDDGASAAPGPDLVGVWRGMAFAVPGSLYLVSTPVELEITQSGTWTWKSGGTTKASGTLTRHGDDVVLHAGPSKGAPGAAADDIPLEHRGERLWGLSRYFIPGAPSAIDLRRQEGRS